MITDQMVEAACDAYWTPGWRWNERAFAAMRAALEAAWNRRAPAHSDLTRLVEAARDVSDVWDTHLVIDSGAMTRLTAALAPFGNMK